MFSPSRFYRNQPFLSRFQVSDRLRSLQTTTGGGLRRPKNSQRRALKKWALSGNHTSILTPKTMTQGKYSTSVQEPESFDGVSDEDARRVHHLLPSKGERDSFVVGENPPLSEEEMKIRELKRQHNRLKHRSDLSAENKQEIVNYKRKVHEILSNPDDDPEKFPPDSYERERANIRRRAKLSMINKDRFHTKYTERAVNDEMKHGVQYPSTKWETLSKNKKKEERWFRIAKKMGLNGLSPEGQDDAAASFRRQQQEQQQYSQSHRQEEDERYSNNNDQEDDLLDENNKTGGMRFVDLDEKIRKQQLGGGGHHHYSAEEDDDGEAAYAEMMSADSSNNNNESHLTPEEIAIMYYERNAPVMMNLNNDPNNNNFDATNNDLISKIYQSTVNNDDDGDDESAYMSVNSADQEREEMNSSNEDEAISDQDSGVKPSRSNSNNSSQYYDDGSVKPMHERLWEKNKEFSKERVQQLSKATNTIHTREQTQDELMAERRRKTDKKYIPSVRQVASNQERFDEILEQAIVLFSPPHRDSLATGDIATCIKRVDPNFSPNHYGSPELLFLLKNTNFLTSWKGKWAFVRLFDAEREDITVKLEKYRYKEAPDFDGIRAVPQSFSKRNISWT